jgi:Asp-tRNA(Asn)/Glu-tRNA(Gln) amidotransferase A subunit family amidase
MCDDETLALFGAALQRLTAIGFELVDVEIEGWIEGERAAGVISLHEGGQALAHIDLGRVSEGLRARAAAASKLTAAQVAQARAACATLRRNVAQAFRRAGADAIVTPTWPFPAPGIHERTAMVQGVSQPIDPHRNCFVRAANAIDACAITLPMGLYAGGVPAGLHLLAEGGNEAGLLGVARMVEHALPALPPLRV